MFEEEAYDRLVSSSYYKGFARNCYIGFTATYIIVFFFLATVIRIVFDRYIAAAESFLIPLVVIGILGTVLTVIMIHNSVSKKTPYLCAYGEILSVDVKFAEVKVYDDVIKASSFEHFLKNKNLENYRTGDKVIIFSGDKKMTRPLFFHADE